MNDYSQEPTKDLIARLRALKESAKFGMPYETARSAAEPILAELNIRLKDLDERLQRSIKQFKWSTRLS